VQTDSKRVPRFEPMPRFESRPFPRHLLDKNAESVFSYAILDFIGTTQARHPARNQSISRVLLDAAAAHSRKISLLLTDVTMPEMNGLELGREINRLYPNMNVTVCRSMTNVGAAM
jgi:DNA-binding NarL/FixJ family response regulator